MSRVLTLQTYAQSSTHCLSADRVLEVYFLSVLRMLTYVSKDTFIMDIISKIVRQVHP